MATSKVADREIVASGTLISAAGEPITVPLTLPGISSVTFVFKTQPGEEHSASWSGLGDNLTVSLTNWDNPLGMAFDTRIGETVGKPIVMALFVHALAGGTGRTIRLISYLFSLGEPTP